MYPVFKRKGLREKKTVFILLKLPLFAYAILRGVFDQAGEMLSILLEFYLRPFSPKLQILSF